LALLTALTGTRLTLLLLSRLLLATLLLAAVLAALLLLTRALIGILVLVHIDFSEGFTRRGRRRAPNPERKRADGLCRSLRVEPSCVEAGFLSHIGTKNHGTLFAALATRNTTANLAADLGLRRIALINAWNFRRCGTAASAAA
jgi:hypothetical protein